ncbi:MAG: DUF1552 domain-containing protein [Pseudomonadota bacterium]
MIAMFSHYGTISTKFFPKKSHGALTKDDLTGLSIEALSPYVAKLLIPRGIRSMNEWTSGMVRGQGNDPHLNVVGSYFTCYPVTPNAMNSFDFRPEVKNNAKSMGRSLDHVMAEQLSLQGTPLFMRVGNVSDGAMSNISYSAPTTMYPGLGQPSQVFSQLTGMFSTGTTTMNPDTYALVKGKSVMDLVADDLATLSRINMSQSDKMKLDAWKQLLTQTTGPIVSAQCNQTLADSIGATQANVNAAGKGGFGSDILTTKVSGDYDGADIYSAMAVLAAACNANPIIFLKYPPNYLYKGLNQTIENHSLSHRIGDATMSGTCVAGVTKMLTDIDTYLAGKFAKLVGMLDGINEGDGTLLDHSAAIWFNEMSDGNAHNLNNLPIIQAGGAGGYFKQGWAVNVEDSSPTLTQGNSESSCNGGASDMVDGTKQSTGTDAKIANAPINKYFVSLMNALGVKGGPDGFPLKGGTAEVTSFGMYDQTEDFIGGGSKPAKINHPGGFDSLKA